MLALVAPLRPSRLALVVACAIGLAGLAAAAAAPAQPSVSATRAQLDSQRGRAQALAGHVAAYNRLIGRLEGEVALLSRRERLMTMALDGQRRELDRTQAVLARERARLARMRAKLERSRRVLAARLRDMYTAERPDLVTVVLSSRGWIDLLERGEFLERITDQDRRVIVAVRRARDAAQLGADRATLLAARQRNIARSMAAARDQVAGARATLDGKRAVLARARSNARGALALASSNATRLQGRLARMDAEQARLLGAAGSGLGSLAGWAIPWGIVRCESGGRNHAPNGAGASGYYQIIPSTWKGFGGRGPAAYLAPKSEQDRIAAAIYRGGAGAHNWVCAGR